VNDDRVFNELRESIAGQILLPGDPLFEEARGVWNARLSREPVMIVRCNNINDVAASVLFARDRRIPLSVKSGGHSYAGLGVCQNSLLIDLSAMNEIRIDPVKKRGYAGPGARWGQFHEAAIAAGLATPGGTVSSLGIAGFTLGGGSGWLSRKYGLAVDNLISVEVVTAGGKILRSSQKESPDLFWGIRGGAGNFGIVTSFEFQLHETGNEWYAGQIIYALEDAEKALKVYREMMPGTPEEFVCFPAMIRIPPVAGFPEELHGQPAIDLILAFAGEASKGKPIVDPLREIAKPILDTVTQQSYMDVQRCFDAGVPKGQRWYSRALYLNELSDEVIQTLIHYAKKMPGPFTFAYVGLEDGAICRVDSSATAYPHRKGAYGFHILAGWSDASEDAVNMQWTRDFYDEMAKFSNGAVYVNLLAEDEKNRIRKAYGNNYNRLVELKRKWDPDNIFRCNQNIPPY
jgi:FAD/FMN-containing dehydrogenase